MNDRPKDQQCDCGKDNGDGVIANCGRHPSSKTVTRLQAIKARTDVDHDGRDIAWLINEVERLTAIVRGLMGPPKRAGYDCPHCHAQIVFGDSICPVTKEQHATPDETTARPESDCSTGIGGVTLVQMAENIKHGLDHYAGSPEEPTPAQLPCTLTRGCWLELGHDGHCD